MNLYFRIAGLTLAACVSVPSAFAQTGASTAYPRVALEGKYGDARFDAEKGRVEWTVRLKPGEQREMPLSYEVVYPRNLETWGL